MIGPTLLHQPAAYLPGTNSPASQRRPRATLLHVPFAGAAGEHGGALPPSWASGGPLEATDPKSTLSTVSSINYHRRGSCTGGLGTVLGLSTSRKVPLRTFFHRSVDSPLDRSTTPDPMTLTESSACSAITTWRECLSSFSSSDYSNL